MPIMTKNTNQQPEFVSYIHKNLSKWFLDRIQGSSALRQIERNRTFKKFYALNFRFPLQQEISQNKDMRLSCSTE